MVGFAYPAYKTVECIENKQKGDEIQWVRIQQFEVFLIQNKFLNLPIFFFLQ